jgi:two-component system, sensor histidine kinase and response regulator
VCAVARVALIMILPAGLILWAMVSFYNGLGVAEEQRIIAAEEMSHLQVVEGALRKELEVVKTDLDYLRATIQHQLKRIKLNLYATPDHTQEGFLLFSMAKKPYDQIRLLTSEGKEYLRVNYNDGEPYLVPDSQLQEKRGRYYFEDCRRLRPGEVYASPFDLNMENGVIERPEKPMIRFGMALFDRLNEFAGAVLVNYRGEILLDRLQEAMSRRPGQLMLVNGDGYFLFHPDRALCWGFMYEERKGLRMQELMPDVWRGLSGSHGRFESSQGWVSYRKLSSGRDRLIAGDGWWLISLLDDEAYALLPHKHERLPFSTFIVMMGLISGVSVLAAINIQRRKMAVAAIYESEQLYRGLSEQLEESNAMKELLLDVLAHDLQNPAGQVANAAEMLQEELPGNEWAELIRLSSESLGKVVANAKTLAKIAIGDQIELEPIDLNAMLQRLVDEMRPVFELVGMQIELQLPDPLVVDANGIIEEVFKNFMTNAIRYAADGRRLTIRSEEKGGRVYIEFVDFGTTIAKESREAIFLRRVQLKAGSGVGSGLGLAIVKRIAVMHHAEVGVRSNQPQGNIFYIGLLKERDQDGSAKD